jgi:hypothetical protein
MQDHIGDVRGFSLFSAAWYAGNARPDVRGMVDEVIFGYFSPDGGTSGEIAMRWYDLERGELPSPRLEVFCDAWHGLKTFRDVIAALADHDEERITPAQFCDILLACGFEDQTPRERP